MLSIRRALPCLLGALLLPAVVAAPASARPTPWGGLGANDLGQASALLSVSNGKAKVTNAQLIMACTDEGDGTESERAFSASRSTAVALRRNKLDTSFDRTSGGRRGHMRIRATLNSNGRGPIRIDVSAVGRDEHGAIVERCEGSVRFTLRRGRTR